MLGLSPHEIAKQLAISERTVRRWQKRRTDGTINQPRRKRSRIFDPYAPYVLSRLAEWMKQAKERPLRHVKRFASGLQRDQAEVLAGLTHSFSNGQVEGFVNKLKLIKRQAYGRASFPLLRQRMRYAL